MDSILKKYLMTLGFPQEINYIPKMNELREQFLKLTMIRLPDKRNGNKEKIKTLLNAYQQIGQLIEELKQKYPNDEEEIFVRNQFKQFNC